MKKSSTLIHNFATFLINYRYAVVSVFLVITVFMFYSMSHLRIETGFKKQLPLDHEYMQTFLKYEKEFGGANRILVALMAKDGDMFTPAFFERFETITNQVFFIPGVDRASVRSIFTPNVRFVEIVEDGFAGGNVILPISRLRPRCSRKCEEHRQIRRGRRLVSMIFPAPWFR
jgi:predicted RND superfamily exporter protein